MASKLWHAMCVATATAAISAAFAQGSGRPNPDALIALLRAGNYAELDAKASAYQAAYEANTDAEWDLVILFDGYKRVDPDLAVRFDAWIEAKPKSYLAHTARAVYLAQRAWSSRGGEFSVQTGRERLQAMRTFMDHSERDLQKSLALSVRPQLSYRFQITSAMGRGDHAASRQALEAALRVDPEAYASRRAFLNALRPEWGGSRESMIKFIEITDTQANTPKLRAVAQHLRASFLTTEGRRARLANDEQGALKFFNQALEVIEDERALTERGELLVVLKREEEALRDLNRALELNPAIEDALASRALIFERRKQMPEALRDYAAAASYGNLWAMQRLGFIYLNGRGVRTNNAEAAKWLRLGAELGDHRAQMGLGYMYWNGLGMQRDVGKGLELWRASAARGNTQAQKYIDDVPWWTRAGLTIEQWFKR